MKSLPRLVIVLIICLVAIALPTMPAQAQCGGPFIELSPGSGVPGTRLIVEGQHFDAGKYVDIYYDGTLVSEGNKTSASGDFAIAFTIPESCRGDHKVLVDTVTSVGTIEMETQFYVTPGLTISPAKGPVGTNVTVTGHGFAKNEDGIELMYYTDDGYERVGRNIIADAKGSWETSFQIPTSTRGEHKLDAQGTASQSYNVKDATFRVTAEISLDKSSGSVGESITMTGSRFSAYDKNIQILFDGEAIVTGITADSQGHWEGSFEVPEIPTGNYTVTAEGEWTPEADVSSLIFEIKLDIVLSPDEGHVGTNVTVTGYGFAASKNVSITYDENQETTATTDGQGSFEGSFLVPQSQHGEHQVTIGYSAGNVASATFTLESVPPDIPQLISPSDRSRVGLKGRVTPTFEWSAVSDDSGVSYNLQIATSANVTATGEFADPIISVTGLVGTNYTVTEALPHGTYYWIVQAVDGAENGSGWTAARSFRVGSLPLWAFIAIIVAIVVLIVALIRALVRRRRYYYD
ncbi:MAG TPA: IPT/TIG domain-containing protein [Dehalococcoidia bacterium]|nr:IPT/TIG domain-containing protein [Dehalococcoidia bacterium]